MKTVKDVWTRVLALFVNVISSSDNGCHVRKRIILQPKQQVVSLKCRVCCYSYHHCPHAYRWCLVPRVAMTLALPVRLYRTRSATIAGTADGQRGARDYSFYVERSRGVRTLPVYHGGIHEQPRCFFKVTWNGMTKYCSVTGTSVSVLLSSTTLVRNFDSNKRYPNSSHGHAPQLAS